MKELIEKIKTYGFVCEAGALENCTEWGELVKAINARTTPPAPQEAERDLTPEEAFAEAQKRWGEYATVKDHGRMFYQGRKITEDDFAVGDCTGVIFHSNKSYRAAFASADKAEAEREKK